MNLKTVPPKTMRGRQWPMNLALKVIFNFLIRWVTVGTVFEVFMKRNCLHLVNKAAVSLLLFLCVTDFYELWYNVNYTRNVTHEIKKIKKSAPTPYVFARL